MNLSGRFAPLRANTLSLIAMLAAILVACVTPIDWTDPQETSSRVRVERDEFEGITWYRVRTSPRPSASTSAPTCSSSGPSSPTLAESRDTRST